MSQFEKRNRFTSTRNEITTMAKRSDIDKAIKNLMAWAGRPDWSNEQDTVFAEHLNQASDRMGTSLDELDRQLGESGSTHMLVGIIFEDFISRRIPPDDRNIIDDYLKRRGWRESVIGRRYLQQLRDSLLSLYEIVDISPGNYCDVRDMVRGGEPVRVYEHMATQSLVKWDTIAARVLKTGKKHIFSGGILPFTREAAQDLLNVLDNTRTKSKKELHRLVGKAAADAAQSQGKLDTQLLQQSCPVFSQVWLLGSLDRLQAPLPELINRDGEELVFTETRFPVEEHHRQEIIQRLDATAEWERDSVDEPSWIWFMEGVSTAKPKQGIGIETLQDGQRPISGTLELKSGTLIFTANSMQRTERGKANLSTLLDGLIGSPLSKIQTPESLMAEHDEQLEQDSSEKTDPIDPEVSSKIIQDYLDNHYRNILDQPIPMLDGKSPRQCTRSKKGRKKVIEWLKSLENNEHHRAASQGQKPYDSTWMWVDLGLI